LRPSSSSRNLRSRGNRWAPGIPRKYLKDDLENKRIFKKAV